jgi:hypothetical protein
MTIRCALSLSHCAPQLQVNFAMMPEKSGLEGG